MNYAKINYQFNTEEILKCLPSVFPETTQYAYICNKDEILTIQNILGMNFRVKRILFFDLVPNLSGKIHIDRDDGDTANVQPICALNIPLNDGNNTYMNWFEPKDPNAPIEYFGGPKGNGKIPILEHEKAVLIDRVKCDTPVVVSVNNWHSADNTSLNQFSKFVSVRFSDDITPEIIINKLSNQ